VVIDTDCIDSCKSNYHTITTTTENAFKSVNSNQYKLTVTSLMLFITRVRAYVSDVIDGHKFESFKKIIDLRFVR
jgi:hypothetical protein